MAKGQNNPAVIANELDRSMPAAARAALGAWQADMTAKFNALLAKLDSNHAAATDHVSTLRVTPPEERS